MDYVAKTAKTCAPGSLMLMGEHSVLRQHWAIATAIDCFITVEVNLTDDQQIKIHSPAYGDYQGSLEKFRIEPPFAYLLALVDHFRDQLTGIEFKVQSTFSSQLGLGSSAAVVAASLLALDHCLGLNWQSEKLLANGRTILRKVFPRASGTDLAASLWGGIISYKMDPLTVEPLDQFLDFIVCYCGYKKPTPEVVNLVDTSEQSFPEIFESLFATMGQCTIEAKQAILKNDLQRLAQLMDIHHKLQQALGTSDEVLEALLSKLRKCPSILGAKISGSGLGDCVIGLGKLQDCDLQPLPVKMSKQGAYLV